VSEREASEREAGFTRVRQPLDRLLRYWKSPPAREVGRVVDAWASIVGPAVASHTTVVSLRDGVLTVKVDDPAWATELRWLEPDIRERLNAAGAAPVIASIKFRVRLDDDRQ